jgi:soluble lytic murein transglycosylase
MDDFARRAGERHPKSQWSVDALTAAGNVHVMKNEVALYEPLFQACYEGASTDPDSEWCHWKVTWAHYLRRDRDAAQMLRDHVRSYPDSEHASTSLYFLSRIAEQAGDIPAARTYLAEIVREYPNLYYAMLARERSSKLGSGTSAPATAEFLRTIAFPQRSRKPDLNITTAAKSRIDRAAILARVGQRDLAEAELRFGADQGEQPIVLGMELARLLTPDDPAKAMRYMKRYARGYLLMPLTSAPTDFWKLAFPLPYRDSLEKHSQTNSIDPFLMAGLVRQESEFDPQARSSTGARGLSQIMPATGQDLARRMNLSYSVARLNQPDYNLQLGTYYVNWLLKQWNGNVEATLASYNAGMARVRPWIAWGNFREPAEFIETIPITQTREYVQAVQRNAATYREIYAAPPLRAAK